MTSLNGVQRALAIRGIVFQGAGPNSIKICCPFCPEKGESPDYRFRLNIDLKRNWGHCFNCEWASKGSAIQRLMRRLAIAGEWTSQAEPDEPGPPEPPFKLPDDFQLLEPKDKEYWNRRVCRYLMGRGITRTQIRRKHIGFSMTGRLAYRVLFPVWVKGEAKAVVARDFTGLANQPYLNSKGIKYLYNLPLKMPGTVVLSEGVVKCLRIEQVIEQEIVSMATLGKNTTEEQLDSIKRSKHVVLWPDPDRPGLQGVNKTAQMLCERGHQVEVVWPVESPADEMPVDRLQEVWTNNRLPYRAVRRKLLKGL